MESNVVTFAELAAYCEKEIYVEAAYNEAGEKLQGVRDVSTYKAHLKHSGAFFKGKNLKGISIADLKRYRSHRLRCTRRGPNNTEVNISPGTVARELTTLARCSMKRNVINGLNIIRLSLRERTK